MFLSTGDIISMIMTGMAAIFADNLEIKKGQIFKNKII